MLKIWLSNPFNAKAGSTGSAVSRLTYKKRFTDLDKCSGKYITDNSIILDIGISTGCTAVELYNILTSSNIRFTLDVTDPYSRIFCQGNYLKSYRNDQGKLFCHTLGPLVFSKNLKYRWLISKVIGYCFDYIFGRILNSEGPILLVNQDLQDLLSQGKINWLSFDVLDSRAPKKYDFIRIMNVLNNSLFSRKQIVQAMKNAVDSLEEKGIILIGRTSNNGQNNATFYQKGINGISTLENVNNGSELHSIICEELPMI